MHYIFGAVYNETLWENNNCITHMLQWHTIEQTLKNVYRSVVTFIHLLFWFQLCILYSELAYVTEEKTHTFIGMSVKSFLGQIRVCMSSRATLSFVVVFQKQCSFCWQTSCRLQHCPNNSWHFIGGFGHLPVIGHICKICVVPTFHQKLGYTDRKTWVLPKFPT